MARRLSNFVNLEDYLGLNKGSGEDMGNVVGGYARDQASNAGVSIAGAQRDFNTAAQGGTVSGPDANAYNRNSNLYTGDQARAQGTKGYSGPSSLSDVNAGLYGQVADAVSKLKGAQGASADVTGQAYGGRVAGGAGGGALDSFLMGQTASSSALSGLKDIDLMGSLGAAEKATGARVEQAKDQSTANAAKWSSLAPMLDEEAKRQAVAAAQGDIAHKQQIFDIAYQQESQYGRGNSVGRAGLQGSGHYVDPRDLAAMGKPQPDGTFLTLEEYDKLHPANESTGAADWDPNASGGDKGVNWDFGNRGAPMPGSEERDRQFKRDKKKASDPY